MFQDLPTNDSESPNGVGPVIYVTQGDWSLPQKVISLACLGKWWCTILRFKTGRLKKQKRCFPAFCRWFLSSFHWNMPQICYVQPSVRWGWSQFTYMFQRGLKPPMRKLLWPATVTTIVAFWVAPSDPKWKRGPRFEHVKSSQETVPIPEINGLVEGKICRKAPDKKWENLWFPVNFPLNQSNQEKKMCHPPAPQEDVVGFEERLQQATTAAAAQNSCTVMWCHVISLRLRRHPSQHPT